MGLWAWSHALDSSSQKAESGCFMNFRSARATWQNLESFKNWKKKKRGQGDDAVVKTFTTQHGGLGLEPRTHMKSWT